MGQRQDLLAGAKLCIAEKGYSRTTARDITAASGANLAAIGYHFGSKEALLNAAVLDSFDVWGDAIEAAMASPAGGHDPVDRLERFLAGFIAGSSDHRATLLASIQAFAESEFVPEIRQQLSDSYDHSCRGIATMLLGVEEDDLSEADLEVGALGLAILRGAGLQLLVEREEATTAAGLAAALRRLAQPGG